MEKETHKKLWFVRKTFGWGWTPSTWQGWAVVLIYIVAVIKIGMYVDRNAHSVSDTLIGAIVPVIILTAILIFICYKKGEKPRWQWGKDKEEK